MERAHSTYIGSDNFLDYWEEYQKMMEETKLLDDYLEEECPRNYDGMYFLLSIFFLKLILIKKEN